MKLNWLRSVIPLLFSCIACDSKSLYNLSIQQLKDLVKSKDLQVIKNVLKYEGAFAVTNLSAEYSEALKDLKLNSPDCLHSLRYPEFVLPDGSIRTTFASETEEYPPCLSKTSSVISAEMNRVYSEVAQLLEHVAGENSLLWRPNKDSQPKQFADLPKKEHIHVYQSSEEEEGGNFAAPFHTDSGILLLLTPFQEHPLKIRTLGGQTIDTSEVGDDSIMILIARGLPDWLLRGSRESKEFMPAPHAVETLPSSIKYRTIFARMMVAPLEAEPAGPLTQKTKFGDIFFQKGSHQGDLCPLNNESGPDHLKVEMRSAPEVVRVERSQQGHAHVSNVKWDKLKSEECSGNSSYCWMGCYPLPTCDLSREEFVCTNQENKGCCTRPEDEGTGTCADMDQTCEWKCSDFPVTTPGPSPISEKFCIGKGTDMFMNGFQVTGSENQLCVILFFEAWVLDSQLKFFFGCIGVILLGIGVEGLLCVRRLLQSRKILRFISSPVRRGSIIVLFGLNIAFGYMAMLVAMTYSVELFLCMVLGLVLGHAIFNTAAPVGESVDPCCASQVIGASNDTASDSSNMPKKSKNCHLDRGVENSCFCEEENTITPTPTFVLTNLLICVCMFFFSKASLFSQVFK
ncbi:uncharacterized protein LOC111714758 isoform X4 [Eurytemora carolleeae]|uniref:uncharacterized protein LOC111714758 isoform X4 n=1 Tax=Eurytemora carolleeae TaxID=1294199 RepID=UPI000C7795B3|nr:uncharacterized protein LOC111714758 isoform X4 [Eurytemora carolleeae]|eukprot:XP_023345714.1 uncharacterized protein LOC111714758 isoform X4 [Eurytemora affinis]